MMPERKGKRLLAERIETRILTIRSQKVILDSDLAEMYGVPTKRLNEQVQRNKERFPVDFMLRLTALEMKNLKSQFATSSWGGRRKLPYAFTEHGAIMAANVLNSPAAVYASVYVVRAFIRMREVMAAHRELGVKLTELEQRLDTHDETIIEVVQAIRKLMEPQIKPRRQIGFRSK